MISKYFLFCNFFTTLDWISATHNFPYKTPSHNQEKILHVPVRTACSTYLILCVKCISLLQNSYLSVYSITTTMLKWSNNNIIYTSPLQYTTKPQHQLTVQANNELRHRRSFPIQERKKINAYFLLLKSNNESLLCV